MTFSLSKTFRRGAHGVGQAATTTFSIPKKSVDYWIKRLDHFKVNHKEPQQRFDEVVIYFEDFDGLGLELVANDRDDRAPFSYGQIPLEHAIRGFYSVELWENTYERTEALLVHQLDHSFVAESGPRRRYSTTEGGKPGQIIDIVWDAQKRFGAGGSGTVHHIAFDTPTDEDQLALRENLLKTGNYPTQVLDRQYFHSIYFREPGGVLFEVATTPPGFLYDEDVKHLGESLKLPPWEEFRRDYIEKLLTPITLNPEHMHRHSKDITYAGQNLKDATRAMIMVHGRGASPASILELTAHLKADDMAFLAPRATANTWYPYSFMAPTVQNEPGLSTGLGVLKQTMDEIKDAGIKSEISSY